MLKILENQIKPKDNKGYLTSKIWARTSTNYGYMRMPIKEPQEKVDLEQKIIILQNKIWKKTRNFTKAKG